MISFGLGLFLCLCHGRSCLSYNSNDGIIKVEDHKGNKHQLCKDELKDDSLVLNWLSSVISTLDSGYVGNKLELHRILVKVRTDLNNYHLQHLEDKRNIALDGDYSDQYELLRVSCEALTYFQHSHYQEY